MEELLGKGLTDALREDRPEEIARKIIQAHTNGRLSLEDLEKLVSFLQEKDIKDHIAQATKELLRRYLVHYIRSQRSDREKAKVSYLIKEALERGYDPVEYALTHAPTEDVIGQFVRARRKRLGRVGTKTLLKSLIFEALKNAKYIKQKTGAGASDLVHLFYFLSSHGLPPVEVSVLVRKPKGGTRIRKELMFPHEYLEHFLKRLLPHTLLDPLQLLLSIRDAYRESRETIRVAKTLGGLPDFVEIEGELYPLPTEFYSTMTEQLGIPLEYILRIRPSRLRAILYLNPDSITQKLRALERLGIPLSYILRARPDISSQLFVLRPELIEQKIRVLERHGVPLSYLLGASPDYTISLLARSAETIERRLRLLEQRAGEPIRELIKKYKPNMFIAKVIFYHPP